MTAQMTKPMTKPMTKHFFFLKTAIMCKIDCHFVLQDVPGQDSLKKSRPSCLVARF
jgi:hypothetical protein